MLKQNKIDAIIAITYSDIEQYIYSNIPFVSLDRYFDKKFLMLLLIIMKVAN